MEREHGPTSEDRVERLEIPDADNRQRLLELQELYKPLGIDFKKGTVRLESGHAVVLEELVALAEKIKDVSENVTEITHDGETEDLAA